MKRVYIESLGCPKNLADSELFYNRLSRQYLPAGTPEKADVIIINTCGFIEPAKQEAIDTILEYSLLPEKRIIVTGCLVNIYKEELKKNLPDLEEFYTSGEFFKKFLNEKIGKHLDYSRSLSITPLSYTYVKVSDGCDRKCSYCVIPLIKGAQYSRPVSSVIREIKKKAGDGFFEMDLIAQDLVNYGRGNGEDLLGLLEAVERIRGDFRVRLLYLYPDKKLVRLARFMSESEKLVPYMDIPLQHASRRILRAMNRPSEAGFFRDLIGRIRSIVPGITLRSTFIIGFPGEKEKDLAGLEDFLREIRFNWAGFYAYSDEEKSRSFFLQNKAGEKTVKKRVERIREVQKGITAEWLSSRTGTVCPAVIDEVNPDEGIALARSGCEAPEIDGHIILAYRPSLKPGQKVLVRITDGLDFDCRGEILE